MVTELSRLNFKLGVAVFKTDLQVISDQFSDNRWILVARALCWNRYLKDDTIITKDIIIIIRK